MPYKNNQGFTLIELVIGIVTLSLSFGVITSLILPSVEHSADQVHQIRAAELGQSMLNEILGRAFDENSDQVGGLVRCGDDADNSGAIDADELCSGIMGAEGESRSQFDDVDDYNGLDQTGSGIRDALGDSMGDLYLGFTVTVTVCNDSNYDGVCVTDPDNGTVDLFNLAKLISITVTTPQQSVIEFATYKANF
jgi:MSHA pilin protein MshD